MSNKLFRFIAQFGLWGLVNWRNTHGWTFSSLNTARTMSDWEHQIVQQLQIEPKMSSTKKHFNLIQLPMHFVLYLPASRDVKNNK